MINPMYQQFFHLQLTVSIINRHLFTTVKHVKNLYVTNVQFMVLTIIIYIEFSKSLMPTDREFFTYQKQ